MGHWPTPEPAITAEPGLVTDAAPSDNFGGPTFGEVLCRMAFIICDDHSQSVEADGMDPKAAKQHMVGEAKPNPTPIEKEVIEFGKVHRDCNIRILSD